MTGARNRATAPQHAGAVFAMPSAGRDQAEAARPAPAVARTPQVRSFPRVNPTDFSHRLTTPSYAGEWTPSRLAAKDMPSIRVTPDKALAYDRTAIMDK